MCVVQANNDRRLLNAIVLVIAVVAVFTANLVTKTIIVWVNGAPITKDFFSLTDEELKDADKVLTKLILNLVNIIWHLDESDRALFWFYLFYFKLSEVFGAQVLFLNT